MKILFILSIMIVFISSSFSQDLSIDSFSLSKIKTNVKSKQISSHDTTGGNSDRWMVGKGEKAIVLDVKDSGVIH